MSKRTFNSDQRAQLEALAALRDDEIDTIDIPEASPESWALARRGGLFRPLKQPVTIRLDADVLAWFKRHAPEGGYQTEINKVLRGHVARQDKRGA